MATTAIERLERKPDELHDPIAALVFGIEAGALELAFLASFEPPKKEVAYDPATAMILSIQWGMIGLLPGAW